jgi:hypothetical protein
MDNIRSPAKGYAIAALLGAVGGGAVVVWGTRAIPNMASRLMSVMQRKMMDHMKEAGINPTEM